jgi:transcriptional regulator with XRE-family HTH domain
VPARTLRSGQGWPRRRAIVSGYMWKLIRESANMTQFQLAEDLRLDVTTIQAWESGRRAITALSAAELSRFRVHLIRRGVSPRLFAVLADAIEADAVIDYAIEGSDETGISDWPHPLAAIVHGRDLTNLVTWPLTGVMPTQLKPLVRPGVPRRGPVARHPVLGAEEESRLFKHLLHVASAEPPEQNRLLRRQAMYLLAFDDEPRYPALARG